MPRGITASGKVCHYEYETWVDTAGRLCVRAEVIEFERATPEAWFLAAKRRLRAELQRRGFDPAWANGHGAVEEFDREKDWATDLPIALTYRTVKALPVAAAA